MGTLTIERGKLEALTYSAGKNDVRHYLNGVCFEPSGSAIAANGHMMIVARTDAWNGTAPVIVPLDAIQLALKADKRAQTIEIDFAASCFPPSDIRFTPVDGTFPEWRRVIPTKLSGEIAQYDSDYIALLRKASKALGSRYGAAIGYNGPRSALLRLHDDVLAVLMPMRNDYDSEALCQFAQSLTRQAA